MRTVKHEVDFCVVGGGMAGLCAAIAAARHGAKVALMHDRPVLGGNASSEIRMHVCGAHGANMRETGLVEEIKLENRRRNPSGNYSIWDSILYEKVRFEPNITLLLNCSVNALEMAPSGNRIRSVTGWQGTSETWHVVTASLFSDCSGDSILAPLSGAEFRIGREASSEFGEDIQPAEADRKTMGMSCLIQFRETDRPQPFIPPPWANVYATDADLLHRHHQIQHTNFWWIEVGGEHDSIHDTETLRDELLKIAFGVIDHIKNRGDHQADNWAVEWVGFLPGKRESRRYVGDHMVTQNDVRAAGPFEDVIAYGGWSMDDHHPAGIHHPGQPTVFHPAPSPFGLPYRALYSRNIENLFFAGRNISATHAAMSSTRVMATCATLGHAVGVAAAIAAREKTTPRGVYERHLAGLQQTLMDDDCYLPGRVREVGALARSARVTSSEGNAEPLRSGIDRPVGASINGWACQPGGWVTYTWERANALTEARLVFDSDLHPNGLLMPSVYTLNQVVAVPPPTLAKAFRLEALGADGTWKTVFETELNYQRLVRVPLAVTARALRLTVLSTWGAPKIQVMAFGAA